MIGLLVIIAVSWVLLFFIEKKTHYRVRGHPKFETYFRIFNRCIGDFHHPRNQHFLLHLMEEYAMAIK